MQLFRHPIVIAVAAATFGSAAATAAPLTLNAGDTYTLNFDFSLQSPAPPYGGMVMFLQPSNLTLGTDVGTVTLFGGLQASGTQYSSLPINSNLYNIGSPEVLDGMFSIVVALSQGSIVLDPIARGVNIVKDTSLSNAVKTVVTGDVSPSLSVQGAVPEPATLALSVLALSGLAAVRRRRS